MTGAQNGFSVMFENDGKKKYLVISAENGRSIHGFQLEMIIHNKIPGLLPAEVRERGSIQKLYYDLTGLISLPYYLGRSIGEAALIRVLRGLTSVLMNSDRYLLDMHSFLMTEDFIYVDPKSGRPCFVFVPSENRADPVESFRCLVSNILFVFLNVHPSRRLPQALVDGIKNEEFNLSDFNRLLRDSFFEKTELNAPAVPNRPAITENPPGKQKVPTFSGNHQKMKTLLFFTLFFAVISASTVAFFGIAQGIVWVAFILSLVVLGKTIFVRTKRNSRKAVNNAPAAGSAALLKNQGDETVLLNNISYPVLQEVGGDSAIPVNSLEYRIGRNSELCDCILPNRSIGRIHAQIRSTAGRYHVFDLNSKNGTFLNDMLLESNREYEIQDGDRIRFAEVDFWFWVRSSGNSEKDRALAEGLVNYAEHR